MAPTSSSFAIDITYTYGSSATTTRTNYWLASRFYIWLGTSSWRFNARYVYTDGTNAYVPLYYWTGSSYNQNSNTYAIRPIVTLTNTVEPTGGSGTQASHYTLN